MMLHVYFEQGGAEEAIKTNVLNLLKLFQFNCCGYNGVGDWGTASLLSLSVTVPSSCQALAFAQPGCKAVIKGYFIIIGGIGVGVLFIEVMCILLINESDAWTNYIIYIYCRMKIYVQLQIIQLDSLGFSNPRLLSFTVRCIFFQNLRLDCLQYGISNYFHNYLGAD